MMREDEGRERTDLINPSLLNNMLCHSVNKYHMCEYILPTFVSVSPLSMCNKYDDICS
jgi:hypothetical protein